MFKIKSAKLGLVAVFLALTAFTQGWPQFVSADANEGAVGGPNTLEQAAISAGLHHVCALLSTGAVECWGWNYYGQVGDNTDVDKLTPTQVLTGVGPTTTTTTTTEPETTTTTTASTTTTAASTTTTAASTTIAVATTVVSASKLPETGSQSDRWIIAAIIAMISGTVLVTRRRNLS